MIPKKLIPLFVFLFTAGVIVSCSSSNPLLSDAESNIKDNNYDAAKTAAGKYIEQNPQNPLGYYWQGIALGQEAQTKSEQMPEQATPIYKNMAESFTTAQQKANTAGNKPGELDRIASFKTSLWRSEHNAAVNLATNDSLKQATENPLDLAIAHLQNAIIIEPDSSLSYSVLAQISGMKENYGEAAKAQQQYISLNDSTVAKDYLLLAQYYRRNDQAAKAVETLENMQQKYPDNIQSAEILADAYSKNGESDKAISTVEKLVEKNPDNTRYRLSLGTQIYQSALKYQDSLEQNSNKIFDLQQKLSNASNPDQIKQQITQIKQQNEQLRDKNEKLTDRALEQLNKVVEKNPQDPTVYNTLGIIYQNKAAVLFQQRNNTDDMQQVKTLDEQGKDQLRKSMTNYEKAAQLNPDNKKYWKSLFQIYTTLGMDQKAKEAEKKAGMQ